MLKVSGKVAVIISALNNKIIEVDKKNQGDYIVAINPVGDISNIDANISVGSSFCIWIKGDMDEIANI